MKTIMVVDDDIYIGNLLEEALGAEGYRVLRAYSGTEAVYVLSSQTPDLVLLDLMLPGLCGEELLPRISGIPVIVLSAKADDDSKVGMLLCGAVDYVTKPFSMKELLARICVHLRSGDMADTPRILTFGALSLNTETRTAHCGTSSAKLTRTEYAILRLLIQNRTQIVSRSTLLDRISEDTPDCTESSLKTHISHLRAKLNDVCGADCIETVWGIGFRMKEI